MKKLHGPKGVQPSPSRRVNICQDRSRRPNLEAKGVNIAPASRYIYVYIYMHKYLHKSLSKLYICKNYYIYIYITCIFITCTSIYTSSSSALFLPTRPALGRKPFKSGRVGVNDATFVGPVPAGGQSLLPEVGGEPAPPPTRVSYDPFTTLGTSGPLAGALRRSCGSKRERAYPQQDSAF